MLRSSLRPVQLFAIVLAVLCLVVTLLFHEQMFTYHQSPPLKETGMFPHEVSTSKSQKPLPRSPSQTSDAGIPGHVYAQPPSKEVVWFDLLQQGGFRHVPFVTSSLSSPPDSRKGTHWIVVTSINPPTPTIEKLATLVGWRVVLVGDTKTPKDWAYPGVIYLNVDAQLALGFSTTQLLRTRSYQRKNIGYLYAILHGARVIYETDDDNALQVSSVPAIPTLHQGGVDVAYMLEYAPSSPPLTINHHAHFSQPSTWPRGYPLESIGDPHERSVRKATVIPAVQQGLANGDPDMDAIFRLTRKPREKRVDFNFAQSEPIALPMGSFGPYNAQNTIFTYEGLWATALPQTVEFRVCDIWRAYFTQRLLWGIGAQLTFVAPYVYQLRNSHSYLDDYISEKQIFDQVVRLLLFLQGWHCSKEDVEANKLPGVPNQDSALPSCAIALARDMAIEGYWGPADAELVRHFYYDLYRVGYIFPQWMESYESQAEREGPWPSACDAIKNSNGGPCKDASKTFLENIDYSLSSIQLEGTCPNSK